MSSARLLLIAAGLPLSAATPTAAPMAAPSLPAADYNPSTVLVNGVTVDYYVGNNCETWDSQQYYSADTCYPDTDWNGAQFITTGGGYVRLGFSTCTTNSFQGYEYYYSSATTCAASAASATHPFGATSCAHHPEPCP